jgi:hypothetical protein
VCVLVYKLDNEGSILYAIFFMIKMESLPEKPRVELVKYKVTSDFILDEYEKAKKKRGKPRQEAMDQLKILSKSIGSYLVKAADE